MIEAACGSCGKVYKLRDNLAGRRAKCGCGAPVEVPSTRNSRPSSKAAREETCANCRASVGHLQQLFDWNGQRVCVGCRNGLLAERRVADEVETAARAEAGRRLREGEVAARQKIVEVEGLRRARRDAFSSVIRSTAITAISSTIAVGAAVSMLKDGHFATDGRPGAVVILLSPGFFGWRLARASKVYQRLKAKSSVSSSESDVGGAFGDMILYWCAAAGVVVAALAPFALAAIAKHVVESAYDTEGLLPNVAMFSTFVISLIVPTIAYYAIKGISAARCPNCGRLRDTVVESVQHLGQERRTERKTEYVDVWDKPGGAGLLGTAVVPRERQVAVDHHAAHRRCNSCGFRWSTRQETTQH